MKLFFDPEPDKLTLEVRLSPPGLSRYYATTAIIDTGASISVIPQTAVTDLDLTGVGKVEVTLADGSTLPDKVPVVDCEVHAGDLGELRVRAAVLPTKVFLLGMNWFNLTDSHYIRLNGGRLLVLSRL